MSVDFRYYIGLAALIFSSCAQVGTITGGDKDSVAPRPIADKINPPNESVNYSGNSLEIPFDEYFRLSNPAANIVMVPPHASVRAFVKKKTLLLEWDEKLEDNTTYAIYLNKVVKDITEGNDSIMQFVFSTGPVIDTMSYRVKVENAWSLNPEPGVVVGLYSSDSGQLINFTQTSTSGIAELNYLSPGNYKVIAFNDQNLNLKPEQNEAVGFPLNEIIEINAAVKDSVPIRMFLQQPDRGIASVDAISEGKFAVSLNQPFEDEEFSIEIDGKAIASEDYRWVGIDSMIITPDALFLPENASPLIIFKSSFTDTAKISLRRAPSTPSLGLNEQIDLIPLKEAIVLEANAKVVDVDTSEIVLRSAEDSTAIPFSLQLLRQDLINIIPDPSFTGDAELIFKENAISTAIGPIMNSSLSVSILADKDFGIINVDVSDYDSPIILYCIQRGKVIRKIEVNNPTEVVSIKQLLPGDYSFRVVIDELNNGYWDSGSLAEKRQPEVVHIYSETTKVRANWDTTVKLTRSK